MKKLLGLLFALVLVVGVVALWPAQAKAASVDDLTFTLNEDGQSYSVTDCSASASGSLEIPATYNGKPVTSIGDYAFENCTSLTSVTIPDSVTSIGYKAFYNCTSLTSVTIPDSVTIIGDEAFRNCTSLTSVHITDIAAWCGIGFCSPYSNPFSNAGNLYLNGVLVTDLIIPDGVTSIGWFAFRGCSSLTTVTIPDSVTSIGVEAFFDCDGLTSVTIPDSVISIGNRAFSDCSSLASITIPDSVTSIGGYAFHNCTSLSTVIYCGTAEQKAAIDISGIGNDYLLDTSWQYHDIQNGVCTVCNKFGCEALGHDWADATCTAPKTCSVCEETEGDALGHDWVDATCTAPKTCSVCGVTEGEALGHIWINATFTAPKTCASCRETEGSALGHDWVDATVIIVACVIGVAVIGGAGAVFVVTKRKK